MASRAAAAVWQHNGDEEFALPISSWMSAMKAASNYTLVMPIDLYASDYTLGMKANIVLQQERTDLDGERLVRVIIPMAEARQLAEAILAEVADAERRGGVSNLQT